MREILFRGMTLSGEWVEGLLTKVKYGKYCGGIFISNRFGAPLAFGVRPETVGQYTGLKDKNGVKIFEGDIISCTLSFEGRTLPHIGVVIYSDNIACFCTKNDAGDTPMLKHCTNTRLIVGNIYENPELMEA